MVLEQTDDVGSFIDTDILRLSALGTNIIVLDSLKAAKELLDKRANIYSGRHVCYGSFLPPHNSKPHLDHVWCS